MIGSATADSFHSGFNLLQKERLSPSQEAEKQRIEARLAVLEKKMEQDEATGLDSAERDQQDRLQARDAEVRAHEKAHQSAAGALSTGAVSLVYQMGPDGKPYAIGGSVKIDTSEGRTPEETLEKAQRIRAAALAPSDPSAADVGVAAQASRTEAQARAEISKGEAGDTGPEAVISHSKQLAFFSEEGAD